jgi:hypothetical protein
VIVLLLLVGGIAVVAVQARGSSNNETVVRISGHPGTRYAGTIANQSKGRKDISGTLGDVPDEYTTGSGQTMASINKPTNDKGPLRLQLRVDGDVVDTDADASSTAPLTVYYSGGTP